LAGAVDVAFCQIAHLRVDFKAEIVMTRKQCGLSGRAATHERIEDYSPAFYIRRLNAFDRQVEREGGAMRRQVRSLNQFPH